MCEFNIIFITKLATKYSGSQILYPEAVPDTILSVIFPLVKLPETEVK